MAKPEQAHASLENLLNSVTLHSTLSDFHSTLPRLYRRVEAVRCVDIWHIASLDRNAVLRIMKQAEELEGKRQPDASGRTVWTVPHAIGLSRD